MRLAFGQRREQEGRRGTERGQPVGVVEKTSGVRLDEFAIERAEMLGQAPAPARRDEVSRLQQCAAARRLPAAHQPGMPAVLGCQQLDDQRALAVSPRRQDKTGVAPFHLNIVVESERGVALGILDPVVAHLDEQKEMDAALQHAFQFGAGAGADRLDPRSLVAEHDRALALAADIDHLVDLDAPVLTLLPRLGLDPRRIGQLLMQLQRKPARASPRPPASAPARRRSGPPETAKARAAWPRRDAASSPRRHPRSNPKS